VSAKLKAWSPDREYIKAMKAKGDSAEAQYAEYIVQRAVHGGSPAFFLDCAHHLLQKEQSAPLGLRVITTLADMKLEDPRLLRILAMTLLQYGGRGMLGQALWLLELVARLKAEEPQSHREVGLTHVAIGNFQEGIDKLWKVVTEEWAQRFQHIEDEVLLELNRTVWLANKAGVQVNVSHIPKEFLVHNPMEIHCTITWDTDDTCIDLHIKEPQGETCNYSHFTTSIGGWSSPDYPGCTAYSTSMLREYMIKCAFPGTYKLGCNYYSNYRQDLTGGTMIWFTVYTNWCTDREERIFTALRLDCNSTSPSARSTYEIGEVSYGISPLYQSWIEEWKKEFNVTDESVVSVLPSAPQKLASSTSSSSSSISPSSSPVPVITATATVPAPVVTVTATVPAPAPAATAAPTAVIAPVQAPEAAPATPIPAAPAQAPAEKHHKGHKEKQHKGEHEKHNKCAIQ
jgi:hypothetical protein